ncbi:MAG: acyltransferase family protein, partial [Aggregatilineales bacterium]
MKERIYLQGLNSIRFWAALFVIIWHIEQFKAVFSIMTDYRDSFVLSQVVMSGDNAVVLFFVLSGFLITYLMLIEIEQTDTVNIRKFYIRRFLRIWPLYYLLVIIGFLIVPAFIQASRFGDIMFDFRQSRNYLATLGLYIVFLPNVGLALDFVPLGISPLWSVGVEEHFYLIWAPLIKRARRYVLPTIIGVIVFRFIIGILVDMGFVVSPLMTVTSETVPQFIVGVLNLFRFEAMAIGGLLAYILYHRVSFWLNLIYHPVTMTGISAVMVGQMLFHGIFDAYNSQISFIVMSLLYGIFIMNVATNPRYPFKLENRVYRHLGKLSYGMYMYHSTVIIVIIILLDGAGFNDDNFVYNCVLYILSIS